MLAELIETARKNAGLTQGQVAGIVGVKQQAVSKWESGETKPRDEVLFTLAVVLGLEPEALRGEAGQWPAPLQDRSYTIRQRLPNGDETSIVITRSGEGEAWVERDPDYDEDIPIMPEEPSGDPLLAAVRADPNMTDDEKAAVVEIVSRFRARRGRSK